MSHENSDYTVIDWPRVNSKPATTLKIRTYPADFFVEERLGFELSGRGEHVFLCIEKTGQTTIEVAKQIARFAGVDVQAIGYAGLKDRNAVTRQWFSVWLPKHNKVDWEQLSKDSLKIIDCNRHSKKLKRGANRSNCFQIILRDLIVDKAALEDRLQWIGQHGVPNYFGPQRFGRTGNNVQQALAWLNGSGRKPGRFLKGMYLSSIRSFLFNKVLAHRVKLGNWDKGVAGDNYIFNGSNACFQSLSLNNDLLERVESGVIHPALMLFGVGEFNNNGIAYDIEQGVFQLYPSLCHFISEKKIKKDWRASRLLVSNLTWIWHDYNCLQLNFELPSGAFATSVLSEL